MTYEFVEGSSWFTYAYAHAHVWFTYAYAHVHVWLRPTTLQFYFFSLHKLLLIGCFFIIFFYAIKCFT